MNMSTEASTSVFDPPHEMQLPFQ
ncbi:hypothetical protein CGRA01v4_10384 [Colletotrichum graminicola]|nr:hypothetical protein CGRA01v4_10384 [Colletotrichum graminicola]